MVPAIGITVVPLPVLVPGGIPVLMEYVPLRAELEYVVCPETGGGFVMGFEFELLFAPPHDSSTKGEHRTAAPRESTGQQIAGVWQRSWCASTQIAWNEVSFRLRWLATMPAILLPLPNVPKLLSRLIPSGSGSLDRDLHPSEPGGHVHQRVQPSRCGVVGFSKTARSHDAVTG